MGHFHVRSYGAFFLSKFNLLVVFTYDLCFSNSLLLLFNIGIRFSTSTFVLFNLDSRFLSSKFLFERDVHVFMSIYIFLLKRDICFQFAIRFSLNIIRFKKQMTKSSRLNKTNVELK